MMNQTDDWVPVMKALADPSRLELVQVLLNQDSASVRELAEALRWPVYKVSKNLRTLREAGIIISEKSGRTLLNRIAPSFARHIGQERSLDLGCCSFRFDRTIR
jgi:DNA-binding transcriptional ArsR family regulator